MFIIKFVIYFSISFFILAFPISQKPIFNYIYQATAPITQNLFQKISQSTQGNIESGSKWAKKLFNNSTPKVDIIKNRQSSLKRVQVTKEKKKEEINEVYTQEEKALLNKILTDH